MRSLSSIITDFTHFQGNVLKFNEESLSMISNDKILGVFVDQNLTWSDHIRHLSKKITSSIWLLSKVKKFLSQEHRILFYKSYIQPHIDFCNIVWGSSSETNKQEILRLQNRACRVILEYFIIFIYLYNISRGLHF